MSKMWKLTYDKLVETVAYVEADTEEKAEEMVWDLEGAHGLFSVEEVIGEKK